MFEQLSQQHCLALISENERLKKELKDCEQKNQSLLEMACNDHKESERQRAVIEKLESDLACSEASQNTLRAANRLMQDLIKNAEYIFTLQLGYFRNENENHKDREYIDYLLGLGRYFNSSKL